MGKRRPAYLRTNIILTVLLFLSLMVDIARDYRFYFTSIDSAVLVDDMVWGVDLDNEKTTVFCISVETGLGSFHRFPLNEDGKIVTVSAPYVLNGQVFFRKILCAEDGTLTEQLISWNVSRQRFDTDSKQEDVTSKSKVDGTDFTSSFMKYDVSSYAVREIDPPEGSEWQKKGHVMLGVMKDGQEKVLDCVHTDSAMTVRHIIIALLCTGFFFAVLMILANLASYYHVYPGFWVQMGIVVIIITILLIRPVGRRFIWRLYVYAGQCVIEHCTDTSYINATMIDQELLEQFMKESDSSSLGSMDALRKYSMTRKNTTGNQKDTDESRNKKSRKSPGAWYLFDEQVIDEESCILFKKDGYICSISEADTKGHPWLTEFYTSQKKYIDQAFSTGQVVSFITIIDDERNAVSFLPAETYSGMTVLIGTRIPLNSTILQFYSVLKSAYRAFIILDVVFLILLIAGVFYALRPLSKLMEALKEISAGNLKVRVKVIGINELQYIAGLFNAMAERLEAQSKGADSYRVFYDAFLPAALLRKMSGRSVTSASYPEAVYRTNACSIVLDAQSDDLSEEKRNDLYREAIQAAEVHGGHPAGFDDKYIRLICMDGAEAALRAVINLQQSLLAKQKAFAWTGMAVGQVRLCVIGNSGRKNVIEQDMTEAESLSTIAADLQMPVIVTEALYTEAMRNTAKLHFRCLGRISKGDYTSTSPLYELLDANAATAKATRAYSQSAFELGVKAYASGDYFTARNEMIKVLGLDPEDLAARCYILNCDRKEPPKVCQVIKQLN